MKYIIYCRKSSESEDRQVLSIPAQISELKDLAKRKGLTIVGELVESQSAKAPGRPVFNALLDQISEGRADGILCWKMDRLARNPIDGGRIQWMLQEGLLKHIQTPEREYKTEDNVLVMCMELGMANQFIKDLSSSVKRGNRERAKRGFPNYLPPLGYLNDTINKTVIKDPIRFDQVRNMWDMLLSGSYSVSEIWRIATEEWNFTTPQRRRLGGKAMAVASLYNIFSRPFYYGVFTQNGAEHIGSYPAMITQEEFDKAQFILGKAGKRRAKSHAFAFTGMVKCGSCGSQVTAEEKTKYFKTTNNLAEYVYYRCSKRKTGPKCNERPLTLDDFEGQIDDILSRLVIPDKFVAWTLKYLQEYNDKEIDSRTSTFEGLQKSYNKKQTELDNLTKMRYRDLINDEEYLSQKNELTSEINNLKLKLNRTEDRAQEWLELTEKTFVFARYASYWFKNGSKQEKREIAQTIGLNFILKDKKLSFQVQKPFQIIMERPSDKDWWAW